MPLQRQNNDFLRGSIINKLIAFAIPMIISNLLQAGYGLADVIIIGQYIGKASVSGVTNGSQITNLITQIIIGITTGGGVIVAQQFGNHNNEGVVSYSRALYTLSFLGGLFVLLATYAGSPLLLRLLRAPAYTEANTYLRICSFGLFFVFLYNGITAFVRSTGNSLLPLFCIAATTLLNIALDLLFICVFRMGVAGAALATVISQAVSVLICLFYILLINRTFGVGLFDFSFDMSRFRLIFQYGIPLALQNCIAALSWLTITFLINDYGVVCSAGNGISMKIKDFCQTITAAMASATSAMIAQNIGAKQYDRAREILYSAMRVTMIIAAVLILLVEVFSRTLVSLFSPEPDVIAAAVLNLRIEIIGQLFYASFFIFHALATGAGHTLFVMFSSFVNCILVRVILAIGLNSAFGIVGVYVACMIAPSASIPLGIWFVRSNRWKSAFRMKKDWIKRSRSKDIV